MGSNIKGGGRAILSDAAEESLVSFLMSRRMGDGPQDVAKDLSEHHRKREHKRFLKNLVEQYERNRLAKKFNKKTVDQGDDDNDDDGDDDKPATSGSNNNNNNNKLSKTATKKNPKAKQNSTTSSGGKVRVELIEAVYSSNSSNSNKKGKPDKKNAKKDTAKKNNNNNKFKEGTKKVSVFPRNTLVDELMKQAKNSLRMKKKPVRCFIVENKKMELDLVGDLSGVDDGTKIYVTSTAQETEEEEKAQDKNDNGNKDDKSKVEGEDDDEVDMLDRVKQAYTLQSGNNNKNNKRRRSNKRKTKPPIQSHPEFSKHFDKLDPLSKERSNLPAAACRETILQQVQDNRVVVICGATGCGKSTQVPQFLWEGMKASGSDFVNAANILVTQPRRVAATSLAKRVAHEMDSTKPGEVGSLVGYNVRLDRAISEDSCKIVYCTVGILLRMLVSPQHRDESSLEDTEDQQQQNNNNNNNNVPLSNISHVVIDEVHERDMNTDFVLTLLRSVLKRNRHIRIILMSATASATKFVEYFGETGETPVVISIPGRTFPVDIHWLDDCQRFAASKISDYKETGILAQDSSPTDKQRNSINPQQQQHKQQTLLSPRAPQKIDNRFIKDLLCAIVREQRAEMTTKNVSNNTAHVDGDERTNGAILVFLPGKGEIEALANVLYNDPMLGGGNNRGRGDGGCNILKLHSSVPRNSQQVVFQRAKIGTTKIVLATNIAETSVTIPDVSHVIDTGRVKENRFNPATRIKELVTVWTSRASTKQRSGRAGRTSAGKCWRLYSEKFSDECMLEQTPPEILRTPLDEMLLQVCLLYEQRRDEQKQTTTSESSSSSLARFPNGVCPKKFLGNTPDPPSDGHLEEACSHLLEVDAVRIVSDDDPVLYRLTPLGYHLSKLPMDTKVGKVLVVGCMLGCLDGALTVAASLSCTKSCFLHRWGNRDDQFEAAEYKRSQLIASGFGGKDWRGGTSRGDLIATIAVYNEWSKRDTPKKKAIFCHDHALDNVGLKEISQLRSQFLDCLVDAGFVNHGGMERFNGHKDDALLTSCCFVAGLYPNICTLMRPQKGGPKGGRLLTKNGDTCRPQSSSFQRKQIQAAAATGKDVYAVYHSKHRSVGTGTQPGEIFLSEVSFVSRMSLLLFGGELEVNKNAVIVDGWLKFKIGDRGVAGAVLLLALRDELDSSVLRHIESNGQRDEDTETLISVLRQLLSDESTLSS